MDPEFKIENAKGAMGVVKHASEGHCYSYAVATVGGTKGLGSVFVQEAKGATRDGAAYIDDARVYAELEARKAGLID
jgi:hypothetical protein